MDLANLPLFSALTRKMTWLTERQKVLAANVANIDTPGYQSSDLRPLDFRAELAAVSKPVTLAVTDKAHIDLAALEPAPPETQKGEAIVRELNGNTVSLEDELSKVSDTAADYALMTNLYKKQIGLFKTAIGHPSTS